MRQKPTRRAQEEAYNRFVRALKRSAWREVLRLTDVRNLASHGVQQELDRLLESNERMAFSEENVYALMRSPVSSTVERYYSNAWSRHSTS
ncbi:MAG: DUF4942 domain-containing protein [Bilophila sp.]